MYQEPADQLDPARVTPCVTNDFLVQGDAISTKVREGPDGNWRHRVHCSLNINTETGRLSARRPNLQNQPAHEKDRYKVRPPAAL